MVKSLINAFLILSLSKIAAAQNRCSSMVPDSEYWNFARLILTVEKTNIEAFDQFEKACEVVNPNAKDSGFYNHIKPFDHGLPIEFYEAVNGFWNGQNTPEMLKLKNALMKIKKIPSAVERVRATYEVVTALQGAYDPKILEAAKYGIKYPDFHFVYSPEKTLKLGGVCRDFAMLLKWALMQVARSISTDKDAETFTPDIRAGNLVTENGSPGLGHMWVSVMIPNRESNGRIKNFQRIDLDPTNFKTKFLPLMPYGQGMSDFQMQQKYDQCLKIKKCLGETGAKDNKKASKGLN